MNQVKLGIREILVRKHRGAALPHLPEGNRLKEKHKNRIPVKELPA